MENTLAQKFDSEEFPFFFLNPKYEWISGAHYWRKKFSDIIKTAGSELGYSTTDVLNILSNNIAALEIVPYHSKSFNYYKYEQLPSVVKMMDFINNYVISKAKKGECLLVILRKGNDLINRNIIKDVESENIIIYEKSECQSGSLSMNSKAGPLIYKLLFSNKEEK